MFPRAVSDIIITGRAAGATRRQVLTTVLRPYESGMRGPDVHLGDHAISSMALIFHELATNASKYGALSAESGRVELSWSLDGEDLSITWNEIGGPAVSEPASEGFGSSLVRSTVSRNNGHVTWRWLPDGMIVSIAVAAATLLQ